MSDTTTDLALIEAVILAIHEGLGGSGWAYMDYGGNELHSCRGYLEDAARAAIAVVKERPA